VHLLDSPVVAARQKGGTVKRVAPLPDLLGLWRGDEVSTGYVHEGLAREICRALKPPTELELFQQLYPGAELEDVDRDIRKLIYAAWKKWRLEQTAPTS
jgi:hypothetical protein